MILLNINFGDRYGDKLQATEVKNDPINLEKDINACLYKIKRTYVFMHTFLM